MQVETESRPESGYETHLDGRIMVQRHWGPASPDMLREASEILLNRVLKDGATCILMDVVESEVAFSPGDLIEVVERNFSQLPHLDRIAYAMHSERHGVQTLVLRTMAFNKGIRAGFFDSVEQARAWIDARG